MTRTRRAADRPLPGRTELLALLVALAVTGLAAAGGLLVLRGAQDSGRRQLQETTQLKAEALSAELAGLTDVVTTWTTRRLVVDALGAVRDGALPPEQAASAFTLVEQLRLARPTVQYAFFTDAAGRSVANSPRNPAALGASFADRDWFQGAVRSGRTYLSGGYRARATAGQPWVVAVASPVYAPAAGGTRGRLLGVVAATYPVSALQAFVDRTVPDSESFDVVDHHGVLLARTGSPGSTGQEASGAPGVRQALAGEHAAQRRDDGPDRLVAWSPVPPGGWALVARQPLSAVLADARQSVLLLAALAAAVVLAVVAAAVLHRRGRQRRDLARREVEALRRATEERFGAIYRASPVGIIEGSVDGTVYAVNDAMAAMLGYDPDEMLGRNAGAYAHPDSAPAIASAMQDVLAGRLSSYTSERLYRHRDGHGVPVLVSVSAVRRDDGDVERLVASVTDITALRAQEQALRVSEQRFRTAFEASLVGMLLLDADGMVLQANAAAEAFFARSCEDLVDGELVALAAPEHREALEQARLQAMSGGTPRVELSFPVPGDVARWGLVGLAPTGTSAEALLVQVEDVTERRAAELLLSTQALHDPLTHLPNRRLLLDRLGHALAGTGRHQAGDPRPALLFLDLDGFKSVNDRYGHEAGDALLVEVADRLRATVRPSDTVARLGGDEFVVLTEAVHDPAELEALAQRLIATLSGPWPPGREVTASVGTAVAQPGQSAEALLHDADSAMYRAKQLGRNRYEAFDEQLRASAEHRVRTEHALRRALRTGSLVLAYQPVVDLADRRVVGVEALVRLPGPDGLSPPADFIQVAEDTGLIVPLGAWVLDTACRDAAAWHQRSGRWLPVAVNVSARQAARPDLEETVAEALAAHGVPPSVLSLELTETVLLAAAHSTLHQLERLRASGVHVGLDDFGTGFSSLSYLAELPLDFLKVDRSFVAGLPDDVTSCAIVESTVRLALRLGLRCVVEGVETAEQLAHLRELGPVQAQGFLLARPLPDQEVLDRVSAVPAQRSSGHDALVW